MLRGVISLELVIKQMTYWVESTLERENEKGIDMKTDQLPGRGSRNYK